MSGTAAVFAFLIPFLKEEHDRCADTRDINKSIQAGLKVTVKVSLSVGPLHSLILICNHTFKQLIKNTNVQLTRGESWVMQKCTK